MKQLDKKCKDCNMFGVDWGCLGKKDASTCTHYRLRETKKIEAIEAIEAYQKNPTVHHLTCGADSNHLPSVPLIIGHKVVLKCLNCGYTQKYIPDFIYSKQDRGSI